MLSEERVTQSSLSRPTSTSFGVGWPSDGSDSVGMEGEEPRERNDRRLSAVLRMKPDALRSCPTSLSETEQKCHSAQPMPWYPVLSF